MSARNPKIDAFLDQATEWQEEMKWGKPCYTATGGNIVIMQPFKAHLSLMFFKGALLNDPHGILRSQGENTQSAKRIELTSPEQVAELESTLKSYIERAVAVEEGGLEVPKKSVTQYEIPEELAKRLQEDAEYRERRTSGVPTVDTLFPREPSAKASSTPWSQFSVRPRSKSATPPTRRAAAVAAKTDESAENPTAIVNASSRPPWMIAARCAAKR